MMNGISNGNGNGSGNDKDNPYPVTVRNFHFLGLTQAVILGVLLIDATVAVGKDGFDYLRDYRFICQLCAVVIFVELYFVLNEYHIDLKVRYRTSYLFYDLFFIGLPFIVLIKLFQKSWLRVGTPPASTFPKEAFLIFVYIFLAISIRQLLAFLMVPKKDPDTEEIIIRPKALIIPMAADLVGVFIFYIMLMLTDETDFFGVNVEGMSIIAFGCLLVYFMLSRIVRIDFSKFNEAMATLGELFKPR